MKYALIMHLFDIIRPPRFKINQLLELSKVKLLIKIIDNHKKL